MKCIIWYNMYTNYLIIIECVTFVFKQGSQERANSSKSACKERNIIHRRSLIQQPSKPHWWTEHPISVQIDQPNLHSFWQEGLTESVYEQWMRPSHGGTFTCRLGRSRKAKWFDELKAGNMRMRNEMTAGTTCCVMLGSYFSNFFLP